MICCTACYPPRVWRQLNTLTLAQLRHRWNRADRLAGWLVDREIRTIGAGLYVFQINAKAGRLFDVLNRYKSEVSTAIFYKRGVP